MHIKATAAPGLVSVTLPSGRDVTFTQRRDESEPDFQTRIMAAMARHAANPSAEADNFNDRRSAILATLEKEPSDV